LALKPVTQKLHVHSGEFIAGEIDPLIDEDYLVPSALLGIVG